MKVYQMFDGYQYYVVAARNQPTASPLLRVSLGELRRYGKIINSGKGYSTAMAFPGTVFTSRDGNVWEVFTGHTS